MAYKVYWEKDAQRDLRCLSQGGRNSVKVAVKELAADPYNLNTSPIRRHHCRKAKSGKYRVVYDVDDEGRVVWIVLVGVSPAVYGRLPASEPPDDAQDEQATQG